MAGWRFQNALERVGYRRDWRTSNLNINSWRGSTPSVRDIRSALFGAAAKYDFGFEKEADALDWIKEKSQGWSVEQNTGLSGLSDHHLQELLEALLRVVGFRFHFNSLIC